MSNASNSEDNDDEVNSENSSTTSLLGTDIQESDNEDDQTNTEDNMNNASNSGDEEDEMDNENSCTTSLFGADIQENEEDLSDSEESMFNATRNEAGNNVDREDLMEFNTGGENTSEFSVVSEDRADTGGDSLPAARRVAAAATSGTAKTVFFGHFC
ncbi:hypothetical protein AOLI_G00217690 [Acnodon oligacanthus]